MTISPSLFGFSTRYINLAHLTDPFLLESISVRDSLLKAIPVGGTAYCDDNEIKIIKDEIGGMEDAYDPTNELDDSIDAMLAGKTIEADVFDRIYGLDEEEIEPDEAAFEKSAAHMNYYENYAGPTYSVGHTEENIPFLAGPADSIEIIAEKILPPKLEEKIDASITKEIEVRKENKYYGRAELSQRHLRKKKGLSFYRGK